MKNLATLFLNYIKRSKQLMFGDFTHSNDPFSLFDAWFLEAKALEPNDPNAMSLATVDSDGLPDLRVVLLKGHDERGFVFYTNTQSAKGRELLANPKAALNFHWKSLLRQVRIRGGLIMVSDAEADEYYHSRARDSQLGAWASQQSQALDSRQTLVNAVEALRVKHGDAEIPRPKHWTGFRLNPISIEFWQDGEFRLHDRVVFKRKNEAHEWDKQRLYP
jgi:pyridoxamine 5'-phosphate oxidase